MRRTLFRSLATAAGILLGSFTAQALEVGEQAPRFTAQSTRGQVELSELLERGPVVLAFYFADFTPA